MTAFSGLVNGLQNGIGLGMAYNDATAKRDEMAKQKATMEEANGAFKNVLAEREKAHYGAQESALADWTKSGKAESEFKAQPFSPQDTDYFAAAQARQKAFAKNGDYDNYIKSAAQLTPMVAGARKRALDQYGSDEVSLAKAVYPTFMDGRDLKSVDYVDGTGPDGKATEKKIRLVTSDGQVQMLPAGSITQMVERSIQSPEAQLAEAKMAFQIKVDAAKAEAAAKKQQETDAARLARETELEDRKQKGKLGLAAVEHDYGLKRINAQGAVTRGNQNHAAGLEEAKPFTLSEGQTRYGKDGKPLASVPKSGGLNDVKGADDMLDLLSKSGISGSKDSMTNKATPDGLTQKASIRVKQLMKDGASLDEAIATTREEVLKRGLMTR